MNQITNPPNNYTFGHDFNYANWDANTTLTMCNVPWDNTYKDLVHFPSQSALDSYIDSAAGVQHITDRSMLAIPNRPISIDMPINVAMNFNYIRAHNPEMPVTGDVPRTYYYFILGVEYESPQSTKLLVELDAWSTYFTQVEFDKCYVERGHIGVANSNQWTDWGKKYLTIPEGLDMGSEYKPVRERRHEIFSAEDYDFMVTSSTSLVANPGTTQDAIVPPSRGSGINPFYLPTETYIIKSTDIVAYLTAMANYPWITQGIIEIAMIPSLTTQGVSYQPVPRTNSYPPGVSANSSYLHYASGIGYSSKPFTNPVFRSGFEDAIPERYRHLKKFQVSPYSMLMLTTRDGNHVYYKPELFPGNGADFTIRSSFMPGNATMSARANFYNNTGIGVDASIGEPFDYECIYNTFPQFPVLNNGALLAIANTARSTAQAYASSDWSYQRNTEANRVSYDNQTAQIAATMEQGELGRDYDAESVATQNKYAVGQAVLGGAAGAAVGGGAGAAVGVAGGAIQAAMQIMQNNENLSMRTTHSIESERISTGLSSTLRNNNATLASYSARGDYENQIAALNARSQEIQMTPPSLQGQLVGEFLKIYQGKSFQLVWKTLHDGEIARIGEFWLRYGYAVHAFLKPPTNLHCMSKFTYWKMLETYVTANIPEFYKNVIRGVFEKGVTVWQNPADIGKVDLSENTPLSGIGY